MNENSFLPILQGEITASDNLSDGELSLVMSKLRQLLGKRVERFTAGESTSVSVETAQELFSSVCFTIDTYLRSCGGSRRLLLTEDPVRMFDEGQRILEEKVERTRELWHTACLGAPDIENVSYRDTLRSIGGFFGRYDYRFFAHDIPCGIDYQLCRPVPESLLGVAYVEEYLKRIIIENAILKRFDRNVVIRLLKSCYRDYRGLLVNLCEPVIVNAAGLSLIGESLESLDISGTARQKLEDIFKMMPETEVRRALNKAARDFCRDRGLRDDFTCGYAAQTAEDIYPRIAAAGAGLDGIFVSIIDGGRPI